MNKLERQNRIIQTIQSSDKITASQLAKQFNVSKRTILRDIDELEDQGVKSICSSWQIRRLSNQRCTC